MKKQRYQLFLFVGLVLLLISCSDWKVKPHPFYVADTIVYCGAYNGKVYALKADSGQKVWEFATGKPINAGLFYANGVVYAANNAGQVYALDANLGTQLWIFQTKKVINDGTAVVDSVGINYSSPVVDGGVLYVGSTDSTLYALEAATGKKKWSYKTGGPIKSSPAISKGVVYFGSFDKRFYALKANNGDTLWTRPTQGAIWSSPAVYADGGIVYVGSGDGNLYAWNMLDGKNPRIRPTSGKVDSSPFLATGNIVYVGSRDSYMYALDAYTLNPKDDIGRYYASQAFFSSPVVYNDTSLYVGNDNFRVYSLNPKSLRSTRKWEFKTDNFVSVSPVIVNGLLYTSSWDNKFYALDIITHNPRWIFSDPGVDGKPNVHVDGTPVIVQGGQVIGTYPSISGHVN